MSAGAYRRIHTSRIWSGEMRTFRRRDREAHNALIYLLTGPASNFIGLYHLPIEWAVHDLCVSVAKFRRIIGVLGEAQYAIYDEAGSVVYVPLALQMDPISTDQQALGAVRQIESLPPTLLVSQFRADILRRLPLVKKPETLRPMLEFLGIVPERGPDAPGLTPHVTVPQTPGLTRTTSPSSTPSGDKDTGSRETATTATILQPPSLHSQDARTLPRTKAEEAFDETVFPMTHEWHTRDLWLKALQVPGAIEAVEKAADMLNGANAHDQIRKPGAFLWAKFQEILGDSSVRQ